MAQTLQDNNLKKAMNYLEGLGLIRERRERPIQFRKEGGSGGCKIRLAARSGHFMDFYNEKTEDRWERFLSYLVTNLPQKWNKETPSIGHRSQLIRILPINDLKDIHQCCDDFFELFEKYEEFPG